MGEYITIYSLYMLFYLRWVVVRQKAPKKTIVWEGSNGWIPSAESAPATVTGRSADSVSCRIGNKKALGVLLRGLFDVLSA